jgi:hypothetical protein
VWNRLYFSPVDASFSAAGVDRFAERTRRAESHVVDHDDKHIWCALWRRCLLIGENLVSGSFASNVTRPRWGHRGLGERRGPAFCLSFTTHFLFGRSSLHSCTSLVGQRFDCAFDTSKVMVAHVETTRLQRLSGGIAEPGKREHDISRCQLGV